jgi:cyclopropane fatty-acyl-phospholipid synthase-like methyltransferase
LSAPDWQWNEMQQLGTDYADVAEVEAYDRRMASFRDVDAENRSILQTLALRPRSTVLEIGCGTGRFARAAAAAGHAVTAVDVSQAMLRYVAEKAQAEGLAGLDVQHAGFLTMDVPPGHFDAAVSVACLHHLPDAWKLPALENVHRSLQPGGQFILHDVVFSSTAGGADEQFERFINSLGEAMRPNAVGHVAKEYSTFDWIMEGLLERAGFQILSTEEVHPCLLAYHCCKSV